MSRQSRGMYAIERINSLPDPVKNISDPPNAQEMHRAIIPHSCTSVSYNIVHVLLTRTKGPSDCCAEKGVLVDEGCALVSQIFVDTALNNSIQSLRSVQTKRKQI